MTIGDIVIELFQAVKVNKKLDIKKAIVLFEYSYIKTTDYNTARDMFRDYIWFDIDYFKEGGIKNDQETIL